MTGASKVTDSAVPNMNVRDRVADRDRKEIDRKHKHHHNHLNANLNEKGDNPTDLPLKSADGKQSLHVFPKDGQWYIEDKDPNHMMGAMGMMGEMNLPSKISAPTFKDGKVMLTIDDKHQFSNQMAYMGVQNQIKKSIRFAGTYEVKSYRKINKGELDAVKTALENASNRESDYFSQKQL